MKFIEKYNWFMKKSGIDYKQYQYDGVKWCYNNEIMKVSELLPINGGFVCDEMGLGKTIMMITLFIMNYMPRTLIVLPCILIEQWRSEILKFTGHKALIYYGKNKNKITIDELNNSKIVLTSYHNISINNKNTLLHEINWNRIVFDEGHHLRNRNNLYLGCQVLKSKIRWLISGTPVQNRKKDFLNLRNCLNIPPQNDTKSIIDNYILRRTKKSVGIILPELSLENKVTKWKNPVEQKLSEDIHKVINDNTKKENKLYMYIKAKQVCVFPKMLRNSMPHMMMNNIIPKSHLLSRLSDFTSKIDSVISIILSNKDNGNGKLVFCHFHEEIDHIKQRLINGGITKISSFDGRVSQQIRNKILNEDNEVIILQIQTGCEGLNLQKNFSEIYFISPNWNPSIEEQAIARCHRIGQTKPVVVYRFNMENIKYDSFDNLILNVQNKKRDIIREIIKD